MLLQKMGKSKSSQQQLSASELHPAPRAPRSIADVIRYDSEIIFPPRGSQQSDHVSLHHDETSGKSFWVLSPAGRKVMADAIRSIGVYADNHPHLKKLRRAHPEVRLPKNPSSLDFQVANLLVAHRHFGFTCADLEVFNKAIHVASKKTVRLSEDVIQPARQVTQWGLDRIRDVKVGRDTVYLLHDQLQFHERYRRLEVTPADLSKKEQVNLIKAYHQEIVDTPLDKWDMGHTRPGGDVVTYQPRIENRPTRDAYYYDPLGQRLIPSPPHIGTKMRKHFTPDEQAAVALDLIRALSEEEITDVDVSLLTDLHDALGDLLGE